MVYRTFLPVFILVSFLVISGIYAKELKPCQKASSGNHLIGAYHPQCEKNGYFKLLQCYGSIGSCWCVNKYGKKIADIVNPVAPNDDICDKPCFKALKAAAKDTLPFLLHGELIDTPKNLPSCDRNGFYRPLQRRDQTFWCVDKLGQHTKELFSYTGTPSDSVCTRK